MSVWSTKAILLKGITSGLGSVEFFLTKTPPKSVKTSASSSIKVPRLFSLAHLA